MISKGNTHNDGVKLAQYMTENKKGERAELWELRGFEATNIKDAFRNVEIMAGATQCEQPFFHLQVRNREGEYLSRQQWEYTANRIERMLGLTGQPRAISFHTYEHNDDQHMHVAWSRIDENTLSAVPLPFFKLRLKKISRELELHFGLEPVTNRREDAIRFAPTRSEQEQARRLGQDIHAVQNTIRECWDRSDCGLSFQTALEYEGMILAQGERRDYVVIDRDGGMHALGKRILDVSAAGIRERMSDLSREGLPTVEVARLQILEQSVEKLKGQEEEKSAQPWDRERADQEWQEAVMKAAIEKEKVERQFVEPPPKIQEGRQEKDGAARPPALPENLKGAARTIWTAYHHSDNAQAFAAALDEQGITLAAASKEEARRSHMKAGFAREVGNFAPEYRQGEIVAVTMQGKIYQLNRRTMGKEQQEIESFLAPLQAAHLPSIARAKENQSEFRDEQQQEKRQQRLNERLWPTGTPQPERKSPGIFEQAATGAARDHRPDNLRGEAAKLWDLWTRIDPARIEKAFAVHGEKGRPFSIPTDRKAFVAALDERGVSFAAATKEEAARSDREAEFAKAIGRYVPRLREGEIVIVTEQCPEFRRDGEIVVPSRIHKLDQALAEKFVRPMGGREKLLGIDATLRASDQRAQERAEQREASQLEYATDIRDFSRTLGKNGFKKTVSKTVSVAASAANTVGKTLDVAGDAIASLFAPTLTPGQRRDGERAKAAREAEGEQTIDFTRFTAELAQARQEEERDRHRGRERGGRDR